MEKQGSNLQVAISMLVGLIVLYIFATAWMMSPLATVPPIGLIAAISIQVAILLLAFIFLPLLWWRNRSGYIGAMVVGILGIVNGLIALGDNLAGAIPRETLILIIPWVVIPVVLIISAYRASKEKA